MVGAEQRYRAERDLLAPDVAARAAARRVGCGLLFIPALVAVLALVLGLGLGFTALLGAFIGEIGTPIGVTLILFAAGGAGAALFRLKGRFLERAARQALEEDAAARRVSSTGGRASPVALPSSDLDRRAR